MAYLSLDTIKTFIDLFQVIYLRDFKVEKKPVPDDEFSEIFILNDSLVLFINIRKDDRVMPLNAAELFKKVHGKGNRFVKVPSPENDYFVLDIYELTPNLIGFEFVYREFIDRLEMLTGMSPLQFDITYNRFYGWSRPYWNKYTPTLVEEINTKMPELKLREVYENWTGIKYNFIILEYRKNHRTKYHAVAYTKSTPENYLKRLRSTLSKKIIFSSEIRGGYAFSNNIKKDNPKTKDLKIKKLFYLIQTKNFKEKDDVWRYADKLLEQIEHGLISSNDMQPIFTIETPKQDDAKVDISRFKEMQNSWFSDNTLNARHITLFERSLNEIKNQKIEHNFMWYIFPRLKEPGWDDLSNRQGFENVYEAKAFLEDPELNKNLQKTLKLILNMSELEFYQTFSNDEMSYWINSSIALFYLLNKENKTFKKVLEKFFDGQIPHYVFDKYSEYLDSK